MLTREQNEVSTTSGRLIQELSQAKYEVKTALNCFENVFDLDSTVSNIAITFLKEFSTGSDSKVDQNSRHSGINSQLGVGNKKNKEMFHLPEHADSFPGTVDLIATGVGH